MVLLPIYSLKYIECLLVATTMTSNKFQFVELPSIFRAVQASGLLANTQRDIVARLASQIGINSVFLYVTQGCKHINSMMKFLEAILLQVLTLGTK